MAGGARGQVSAGGVAEAEGAVEPAAEAADGGGGAVEHGGRDQELYEAVVRASEEPDGVAAA
jgi:hypothetical protein